MTGVDVEQFVADGFVRVERAFDRDIAAQVCGRVYDEIRVERPEFDEDVSQTWPGPVVRIRGSVAEPFAAELTGARLRTAFDELVGAGRWQRAGFGTFSVRFPHPVAPDDAGWHIDGSYLGPDGAFWANVNSRGRALLMLYLFTDIGPDDAPTRIRVGSHRFVPPILEPAGDDGLSFLEIARRFPDFEQLPVAYATGRAGDVYLCHPFLVHAADRHRGAAPRVIAQPPLAPIDGRLHPDGVDHDLSPVERAIRLGLRD